VRGTTTANSKRVELFAAFHQKLLSTVILVAMTPVLLFEAVDVDPLLVDLQVVPGGDARADLLDFLLDLGCFADPRLGSRQPGFQFF
jgi:hypothetical protein